MKTIKSVWWSVLLIGGLLASCSTTNGFFSGQRREVQRMLDQRLEVKALSSKLSVQWENLRLAGQLEIRTDSCLWLSIKPFLGMEVARTYLNQTDWVVLSRLSREYLKQPLEEILPGPSEEWVVLLNHVLTNQLYLPRKKKLRASDFAYVKQPAGGWLLKKYTAIYRVEYVLDAHQHLVETRLSLPYRTEQYWIRYDDFRLGDLGDFPHSIEVNVTGGKQDLQFGIHYQSPVFNSPKAVSVQVPSHYSPMTWGDLFKLFQL